MIYVLAGWRRERNAGKACLDVIYGMDVLHAIQYYLPDLLQAFMGPHRGHRIALDKYITFGKKFDGLIQIGVKGGGGSS